MSIFNILRKLLTRHMMPHLVIPLIIGLSVDLTIALLSKNFHGWSEYWVSRERLGLFTGVFLAYSLIAGYFIYKETKIQTGRSHFADLTYTLSTATGYFATSTLRLKDWFEPYVQVYLSHIVQRQLEKPDFRHERILLFFSQKELNALGSQYLDEHYAKALLEIHKHYNIPLAYLKRKDIHRILDTLTFQEKKVLKCYPRWISWCNKQTILDRSLKIRSRIPELDFALVSHSKESGKQQNVFPFSKKGEKISLRKHEEQEFVKVYEKLVLEIRKVIYKPNSNPPELHPKYDFRNFY